MHLGSEVRQEIIAIEADVQGTQGHVHPFYLFDAFFELSCQEVSARIDPHDDQTVCTFVDFEDLVSHTRDGPLYLL